MIGQTVSHYRIVAKLGEGGMGVVYRAEDTKLERTVALKFLSPELTRDPQAKARFVHEAKSASALDHPNLCTIHEIDETEDGRLFIAMAYYEGETLGQRLARGPLRLDEVLGIVMQVAQGLAKAHEQEIVHRDIKPANIFITSDGFVKILDFGLAKLSGQTRVTQTGHRSGTFAYMSPEQAQGEDVDARSDIFSLGIVLYELLARKRPFQGDSEVSVLYQIVHAEPAPLTGQHEDLPEELCRIVTKTLAKNCGRRYQSVRETIRDLQELQDLQSRSSLPTQPVQSRRRRFLLGRPARRHGVVIAALLALLVVALGLGAWTLWRGGVIAPSQAAFALAVVDFHDLVTPEELSVSAGMMGLLNVGLVESCPIRVVSTEYLHDLRRRLFGAEPGPIGIDQALEVARQAGATLLLTGQIGLLETDKYVTWRLVDIAGGDNLAAERLDGDDLMALVDRLIADVLPVIAGASGLRISAQPRPVDQLTTSSQEAYWHYLQGVRAMAGFRRDEALQELTRAVALDSTFALSYLALSQFHYYAAPAEARANWNKAWQQSDKLGVKDRMRLEAMRERLQDRVNYRAILKIYDEMLTRWPDDLAIMGDLTEVLSSFMGRYDRSLAVVEKGLQLYPEDLTLGNRLLTGLRSTGRMERLLGAARDYLTMHPGEPNAWDELGLAFLGNAQPDSAEAAYRRALKLDPAFWVAKVNLAEVAFSRGDVLEAAAVLEDLWAEFDSKPSSRFATHATHVMGLAFYYGEIGRTGKVRDLCEASLRDKPRLRTVVDYCQLLLSLGEPIEVLQRIRAARQTWDPHQTDALLLQEGMAYVRLDSLPQARAVVERVLELYETYGENQFSYHYLAANLALAENRSHTALRLLQEAMAYGIHFPGPRDIALRDSYARALREAGQVANAVAVLQETLRLYGGHALGHYELGQIYEDMGRTTAAVQEYSTFLDMWSEADEALPQVADARQSVADLR